MLPERRRLRHARLPRVGNQMVVLSTARARRRSCPARRRGARAWRRARASSIVIAMLSVFMAKIYAAVLDSTYLENNEAARAPPRRRSASSALRLPSGLVSSCSACSPHRSTCQVLRSRSTFHADGHGSSTPLARPRSSCSPSRRPAHERCSTSRRYVKVDVEPAHGDGRGQRAQGGHRQAARRRHALPHAPVRQALDNFERAQAVKEHPLPRCATRRRRRLIQLDKEGARAEGPADVGVVLRAELAVHGERRGAEPRLHDDLRRRT